MSDQKKSVAEIIAEMRRELRDEKGPDSDLFASTMTRETRDSLRGKKKTKAKKKTAKGKIVKRKKSEKKKPAKKAHAKKEPAKKAKKPGKGKKKRR